MLHLLVVEGQCRRAAWAVAGRSALIPSHE